MSARPLSLAADVMPAGAGACLDVRDITRHFPVGDGLLRTVLGAPKRSVKAVDG